MPRYSKRISGVDCVITVIGADVSAQVGGATVFNDTSTTTNPPGDVIRAARSTCKVVADQFAAQEASKDRSAEAKADAILLDQGWVAG